MSKEHLSVVVCGHVDAGELSRSEVGGGGYLRLLGCWRCKHMMNSNAAGLPPARRTRLHFYWSKELKEHRRPWHWMISISPKII